VLGLRHIWGTREMHTRFWWGYLRERDDYEHLVVEGMILS